MTTTVLDASPTDMARCWSVAADQSDSIEQTACALVARHAAFRERTDGFEFHAHGRVLTVRGSVPSFYLKQMLQTMLVGLDGVARVENLVDVVCSYGLSSVRSE